MPTRRLSLSKKKTTARSTAKTCPSEHIEQRTFVEWWRKTQLDDLFAIPNAGKRSKAARGRLLLEGMTAGVWDLYAPARFMWIEFKRREVGALSQAQKDFGTARLEEGYQCMVAWGCDDAIAQLQSGIRASWKRPKKPVD